MLLELQGLTKHYDKVALEDVSLSLDQEYGDFLDLMVQENQL